MNITIKQGMPFAAFIKGQKDRQTERKEGKDSPQEILKIKALPDTLIKKQRHSPDPPLMTGDLNPIDNCLHDARVCAQQLANLGGGDVLPLPAERVTQAVTKEPAAVAVAPEGIAGAVVLVALAEDVPGDLLLRGRLVLPVAAEGPAGHAGLGVEADQDLAPFLEGHAPSEARVPIAHQLARLGVGGDGHVHVPEEPALDGAVDPQRPGAEVAAAGVAEAEHHLGGVVELVDGLDAEALAEGDPDVPPQAVAEDGVDRVGPVQGRGGLGEEVPESLADVDEEGRAGGVDVGPEGAGGEAWGDEEGIASLRVYLSGGI